MQACLGTRPWQCWLAAFFYARDLEVVFSSRPQRREELWKGGIQRTRPRQPSSQPWCTRSFSSAELMLSIDVNCCLYIRCTSHRTQPLPLTKEHCDPGLFSMDWHAAEQLLEILFSPFGESDHPGIQGHRRFESRRQSQSRRRLQIKKQKETVIDRDILCVPTGRSQIRLRVDTDANDSSSMCADQHEQHLTNRHLNTFDAFDLLTLGSQHTSQHNVRLNGLSMLTRKPWRLLSCWCGHIFGVSQLFPAWPAPLFLTQTHIFLVGSLRLSSNSIEQDTQLIRYQILSRLGHQQPGDARN